MPAIAAKAGIARLTTSERLTSAWRVIAPITTASPSSLMPLSAGIAERSTSCVGLARRIFKVGIKVIPPATSLASSSPSSRVTSSRLAGFWYSNSYIGLSLFGGERGFVLLDRAPQALGGQRHLDMADAERLQRVDDGVGDRRRSADRAGLAAAFDSERVVGAQRHMRRQREIRQIVGARHRVIVVRAGQQLTGFLVVDAAFEDGLANPLRQPAMHLAGDDHRVDDAAEIVRRREVDDLQPAGVGIDLDFGDMRA